MLPRMSSLNYNLHMSIISVIVHIPQLLITFDVVCKKKRTHCDTFISLSIVYLTRCHADLILVFVTDIMDYVLVYERLALFSSCIFSTNCSLSEFTIIYA